MLARLGAKSVVASDLEPNLKLLQENCRENGKCFVLVNLGSTSPPSSVQSSTPLSNLMRRGIGWSQPLHSMGTHPPANSNLACLSSLPGNSVDGLVTVVEHTWGSDTSPLKPPFDLVVACGKIRSVCVLLSLVVCHTVVSNGFFSSSIRNH